MLTKRENKEEAQPKPTMDLSQLFLSKAEGLMQQKNYVDAIKCYSQVISFAQKNKSKPAAQVFLSRGKAYKLINNLSQAEDDFDEAYLLDKTEDKEIIEERNFFYFPRKENSIKGMLNDRLEQMRIKYENDSKTYQIEFGKLGSFLTAVKLTYDAMDDFHNEKSPSEALKKVSESISVYFTPFALIVKGRLLYKMGKYAEAIENFKQSLSAKECSYPYFGLGFTYLQIEDYELARINFLRAIQLNPKTTILRENDIKCFLEGWVHCESFFQGVIEDTIRVLRETTKVTDSDEVCFKQLFTLNKFLKDNDIINNLYNPDIYFERSKVFLKLKRYEHAINDLTVAIWLGETKGLSKHFVHVSEFYLARRDAYIDLGKLHEASLDNFSAMISVKDLTLKEICELGWVNAVLFLKNIANNQDKPHILITNISNHVNFQFIERLLNKAEMTYQDQELKKTFFLYSAAIGAIIKCFPQNTYFRPKPELYDLISSVECQNKFIHEAHGNSQENLVLNKIIEFRQILYRVSQQSNDIKFSEKFINDMKISELKSLEDISLPAVEAEASVTVPSVPVYKKRIIKRVKVRINTPLEDTNSIGFNNLSSPDNLINTNHEDKNNLEVSLTASKLMISNLTAKQFKDQQKQFTNNQRSIKISSADVSKTNCNELKNNNSEAKDREKEEKELAKNTKRLAEVQAQKEIKEQKQKERLEQAEKDRKFKADQDEQARRQKYADKKERKDKKRQALKIKIKEAEEALLDEKLKRQEKDADILLSISSTISLNSSISDPNISSQFSFEESFVEDFSKIQSISDKSSEDNLDLNADSKDELSSGNVSQNGDAKNVDDHVLNNESNAAFTFESDFSLAPITSDLIEFPPNNDLSLIDMVSLNKLFSMTENQSSQEELKQQENFVQPNILNVSLETENLSPILNEDKETISEKPLYPFLPYPSGKITVSPFISEIMRQIQVHLEEENCMILLNGGYVRNLIAGIESSSDVDIACSGSADRIANFLSKIGSFTQVTTNFGDLFTAKINSTIKLQNGSHFINGEEYLNGVKCKHGVNFKNGIKIQIVRSVYLCNKEFSASICLKNLALSSDFTMNAAFSDRLGNVWMPLPNTLKHIKEKYIQTTQDSKLSCINDSIIMLRALYFKETLNFNLAKHLTFMIRNYSYYLNQEKISADIINTNLSKAIKSGKSLNMYNRLLSFNVLPNLFPNSKGFFDINIFNDWVKQQLVVIDTLPVFHRSLNYVYMVMIIGMINLDKINSLDKINKIVEDVIENNRLFKANFSTYDISKRKSITAIIVVKCRDFMSKYKPVKISIAENTINPNSLWHVPNANTFVQIAQQPALNQAQNIIHQGLNHNQ